jgi:hypothetical protein
VPAARKPKKPVEPDDLVRQEAGNYLSGDERFEVRQSDSAWYVVDRQQTNEFGQELMHGPFGSMKAAKTAMAGARDIKPLLRSVKRPAKPAPKQEPAKPPPTWIDKLPDADAAAVRKQIRALERERVADAEALVRKDRQARTPAVAGALLRRELDHEIDKLPKDEQPTARAIVERIAQVLASGDRNRDPLPGWALVELGPDREPTGRRLRLSD